MTKYYRGKFHSVKCHSCYCHLVKRFSLACLKGILECSIKGSLDVKFDFTKCPKLQTLRITKENESTPFLTIINYPSLFDATKLFSMQK